MFAAEFGMPAGFPAGIRCLVIQLVSTCIQTIPQCNTAYLEVWSHECSMNSMSRDVNATPLHGQKPCRLFTNVLGSCTEGDSMPAHPCRRGWSGSPGGADSRSRAQAFGNL